jgi:hypothetical protein
MSSTGTLPLATPMPSRKFPRGTLETPDIKGKSADYFLEGKFGRPGFLRSFAHALKLSPAA